MVITIDSGTQALIYELALITAIFGLDWISKKWTHVQLCDEPLCCDERSADYRSKDNVAFAPYAYKS